MPQYWKQLLALTRPSIGRRMALLILAFSSVVTLVFTALQLSIEFNRDVRDIEAQLTQIRSSYSKSLANSLWVGSKHDVALQLEGINRLPDMQYSEVLSEQNQVVAQTGKRMVGRAPRIETPLYYTHRNQPVYVGKLLTVASLDGAYQRLKDKVIVILLSQFTKTLLVSLFILFLFQWLVGRYLKHIADYSETLQAHQLDQPLALNRRQQNNPAEDELDLVVGAINTMRSNLHASTQDLRLSEQYRTTLFETSPIGLALARMDGTLVDVNPAYARIIGRTVPEVRGLTYWEITPQFYADQEQAQLRSLQESGHYGPYEKEYIHKDGHLVPVRLSGLVIERDGKPHIWSSVEDISERKLAEEHIWKQANFDTLTGLPNRDMFHDRMQQEMLKTERAQSQLALLLIDLDQFKEVNDALGHDVGDTLLQATAQRIRGCVRDSDTVARLGGDEFAVIISELAETATNLDEIAQKLIVELAAPYRLGDEIVHVSASIGISLYPNDASAIDVLLKTADQAMYAAKNLGRNCFSYFTAAMQDAAQTRLRLSGDLRLALERNEFLLHYQPQVSVETGRVTGVEALVRWQHPEKGLIPPNLFIPIAEDTGLILPLGAWVMRTACQQLKKWHESGMIEVKMSVNLSARQFRQEGLATCVSALLAEMGLPAELLELEITESLAMDNPQENAVTLKSLRDIGVSVAIDDFGTGHSSLGYLKDFPISRLKLDRTFIMHIETEPSDAIIVSAAVNLAHALGMDVVAEGVETVKQVEYLARLDCDIIQGYYYSQPLLAAEAEVFIREHNVVPRTQMMQAQPDIDILVIDDDDWVCHFLTIVFKNMGHRPVTETDPIKGLEVLRQNPEKFELILLDMLLPNLSGIELVRKVRGLDREVPLIIITSHRSEAILKTFKPLEKELNLLHGINYFIMEKPLTEESFSKQGIARITRKMGLASPQPACVTLRQPRSPEQPGP